MTLEIYQILIKSLWGDHSDVTAHHDCFLCRNLEAGSLTKLMKTIR